MASNGEGRSIKLPDEDAIGMIGRTPVTRVGHTWLPLTQLITWGIFTRSAARREPGKSRFYWSREGFSKMAAVLGSEWCHNVAHVLASNWIGKPMDALRIQLGLPRCIYHELNDQDVTPRQHIIRSLGGPVISLILLVVSGWAKQRTRPDTIAGETAKAANQMNLFLSLVSLLPIPGIDGGPILKWSLVEKGKSIDEADRIVQEVNGPLALILGLFSSWAFISKRILSGVFGLLLGGISLSVYAGWLKEKDVSI